MGLLEKLWPLHVIHLVPCQQESNSKLKEDVCSPPLLPPPAAAETQPVSHGMSSSELGRVIRADHDYIELLVKVKVEDTSSDEEEEIAPEVPIDIKEEVIEADSKQSMFDNLSTLAEVSLATAGQLEDKTLKRKIDQARAKISKTILPVTPEQSSKRTMQVVKMQNVEMVMLLKFNDLDHFTGEYHPHCYLYIWRRFFVDSKCQTGGDQNCSQDKYQ